jgi:hypothetical protein
LSTVHDRLVDVLGSPLRHVQWVSDLLTEELKAQRVTTSLEMLRILQNQEPMNFTGIVTGAEPSSLSSIPEIVSGGWRNENAPEMVSQKISTEKHRLTVFWSPTGHWLRNGYHIMAPLIGCNSVQLSLRA